MFVVIEYNSIIIMIIIIIIIIMIIMIIMIIIALCTYYVQKRITIVVSVQISTVYDAK